jgi:plasmid maintenance system antidote protein VapI
MTQSKAKRPTIAETLRTAITDSDETVYAIAKGTGIAQPVLWRFVAGERDLTLRTATKLLEYFDLEIRPKAKGKPRQSKAT